jgi:hypothetical protein
MSNAPLRTVLQLAHLDDTGDSCYRMRWPAAQLAQQDTSLRVINLDARAPERYYWAEHADLLVLFQSSDLDLLPIIEKRKARGLKTFAEYNDNFYAPQPWSPIAKEWSSPLLWQSYEIIMRAADRVLVTGEGLRELFASVVPSEKIAILENHLPDTLIPLETLIARKSAQLTFGWAGSLGHIADSISFAPTLQKLLKLYPESSVALMGNVALPESLALPPERLSFTPWGTMREYFAFWLPVTFGLIPLIDTPYNRCRSDIKAVEMVSRGVVPIIPDALPYRKFIAETGAPCYRHTDEIPEIVSKLWSDSSELQQVRERLYHYVAEHRIGHQVDTRLKLYRDAFPSTAPATIPGLEKGAGYHELAGSTPTASERQQYIDRIRILLKRGSLDEAQQELTRVNAAEEFDPERRLLALSLVLKRGSFPEALHQLKTCVAQFPRDTRFCLLYLGYAQDSGDSLTPLQLLREQLSTLPEYARSALGTETLRTVIPFGTRSPNHRTVVASFAELFPYHSEILLFAAQHYHAIHDDTLAHRYFSRLLEMKKLMQYQVDHIKNIEYGYLAAFTEALAERVKEKTGER